MGNLRLPNINKSFLAGRITRDPESGQSKGGVAYARFGFVWSTKRGETEERLWAEVTCFGKVAEYVAGNMKKGRAIYMEGQFKTDEWTDTNTKEKRQKTKFIAQIVQALEWDDDAKDARTGTRKPEPERSAGGARYSTTRDWDPSPEDDIPF